MTAPQGTTAVEDRRTSAVYRSRIGDWPILTVLDGSVTRDRPDGFVRNADPAVVEQAFRQAGTPPGRLTISFTILLIEHPDGLVLVDAGFGANGPATAGRLIEGLALAGYGASDVRTVLLTHCHGDHISGLITPEGQPVFANASVRVPKPERDFWLREKAEEDVPALAGNIALCRRVFDALGDAVTVFAWGDRVLSGITALHAEGHTPGHTMFLIESAGERLLHAADVTNNPLVFARYPDWQAAFDIDGARAAETRHRVLGEASKDMTRLFLYHAPFPALGHVTRTGDGFAFMPEMWQ